MLVSPMQNLLTTLGIELILFDLDDTLLDTHTHFRECLEPLKFHMAVDIGIPFPQFSIDFENCLVAARGEHHVHPQKLWLHTFKLLRAKYPQISAEMVNDAYLEIQTHLYGKPIPLKPGALELLKLLKRLNVPIGIVTNADPEWTYFKLAMSGIDKIVRLEHITIIPPYERKSSEHWLAAIEKLKMTPDRTLVIGDNALADIVAAQSIGVRLAILLQEVDKNWSEHAKGFDQIDQDRVLIVQKLTEITNQFKITEEFELTLH